MEKNFKDLLAETKGKINDLLTKDSSKEDIERITEINKSLDSLTESYTAKETELSEMKEMVVNQVKNTGFKPSAQDLQDNNPISVEEAIESSIQDILAKRK